MRWKIHKLGFLHFWLYDEEEFILDDGHILLRGNNASGKSITTQSFIPFLLDGNRRPERFDSFGSRDRRMEFYLLGDDEREDSTGYLYLEFRKPDVQEYLTLGIGLRAQKGKSMEFWGFCLRDGRRICPDGLSLCQRVGNQIIPLSKRQLKGMIDANHWAESADDYKAMVNRELFGFEEIWQYDQLIQLLLKVRAPKLSKDMRPTDVKTILRDSLQVLTDADLSAMVSAMEQMDQLDDTMKDYQSAMKDVRALRREYDRYNQYMLGKKGRAYLDAAQAARTAKRDLEDAERNVLTLRDDLETWKQKREDAERRLDVARIERREAGEDDLSRKEERLQESRKKCETLQTRIEGGEKILSGIHAEIPGKERRIQAQERKLDETASELRDAIRELDKINVGLELGEEHQRYLSALRQAESGQVQDSERTKQTEQAAHSAWKLRKQQITDVLGKLRQTESAQAEYDAACEALDRAETVCRTCENTLRDASEQERQAQSDLTEAFSAWRQRNEQLQFSPEDWQSIRRALASYREPSDWTPIQKIADDRARQLGDALREEKLRAENVVNALKTDERKTRQELERVRSQKEPVPDRRPGVEAARIQLAMRDIPHAAFYETIDFAPELSQPQRDLLEAQLRDAGLLDALLVPEAYQDAFADVLAECPDSFLFPGAAAGSPVTGLIPDAGSPFHAQAAACLRGISGGDWDAETALLPDGRFRVGMIRGRAHAGQTAGFVGAAARQKNRERQIQQLQERLEELSERLQEARDELTRCVASLKALEAERRNMPEAHDLNAAIGMRKDDEAALQRADEERTRAKKTEQNRKFVLSTLERECREAAAGLPYARTIAGYQEASDNADEYHDTLSNVGRALTELRAAAQVLKAFSDELESLRIREEEQSDALRTIQRELEQEQARTRTIQQDLDSPENRDRARRIRELGDEIERLTREKQTAGEQCAALEVKRETSETSIASLRTSLERASANAKECEQYFSEDLSLNLCGLDAAQGLSACAKSAADAIPANARGRSLEEMGAALSENFQKNHDFLQSYHPKLDLFFDKPETPSLLRQRQRITLSVNGKEMSLYAFADFLQSRIDEAGAILEQSDRELFENILMETISHKLRGLIERSGEWAKNMSELMGTLDTSMGLTFSLDWKPRDAQGETELDTAELVRLLNKDRKLLTVDDSQRVAEHFRAAVKRLREDAEAKDEAPNYADLIRRALDYREWYAFRLFYQREGEAKKELTDRVFNRFSGGEKAMAMYVPLFASVSAHYQKARKERGDCPMILALDEAFAGVDEKNIAAMFALLRMLDFDYILNSQSLWGCYDCVKNLNIAELHRPANASVVTVLRYYWNGSELKAEDAL